MIFKDKFSNNNTSSNSVVKCDFPQGSTMVPLLLFIYFNYLPNVTVNTNLSDNPKTILFTYDTRVVVKTPILLISKNLLISCSVI